MDLPRAGENRKEAEPLAALAILPLSLHAAPAAAQAASSASAAAIGFSSLILLASLYP